MRELQCQQADVQGSVRAYYSPLNMALKLQSHVSTSINRASLAPAKSLGATQTARFYSSIAQGACWAPLQACLLPGRKCTPRLVSSIHAAPADSTDTSTSSSTRPIIVWFKADLRLDDHEGLLAAVDAAKKVGGAPVLPMYCLDPEQIRHLAFIPSGPETLVSILEELRSGLQARGSDLVIVQGEWKETVPRLAKEWNAQQVIAQQEVEYTLSEPLQKAAESLQEAGIPVSYWTAPIWPPEAFKHDFRKWRVSRPTATSPKPPPEALPPLPAAITKPGNLPSAAALRQLLAADPPSHLHEESAMRQEVNPQLEDAADGPAAQRQRRLIAAGRDWLQRLAVYLSLGPGKSSRHVAGANGNADQELAHVLTEGIGAAETPAAEGHSFPAMFATALSLGALSRRRVYERAMASGQPSALMVKAAAITAESGDFHWQLATRNDQRPPDAPACVQQRHWRWSGFLTDYCVAEPPAGKALPEDAPAVLLVHGFGAFGDQWRGNMEELAAAGYRVYAPTMPGFGRSEKVAVPYSQVLWSNFLRDFVVQVIGSPVVVAGNSIGGFISSSMAADHPSLVKGLVLMNSAGPIQASGFSIQEWEKQAEKRRASPAPKWLAQGVSSALIWYLERTVPQTLQWLYPTNPSRARGWLAEEIQRAAADVGALEVFASVFYLPPPKPLNWLVTERYKGPLLVLQGVLDPLNDATTRARELGKLCAPHVEVVELQAGHCPHDEVPDQVNKALLGWMGRVVLPKALEDARAEPVSVRSS